MGRSAPQNGLTRVGRHPRMAVPGSQAPQNSLAVYMLCVCMVCGTLGELTKLCAYVYSFIFRYLCFEGEGAGAVAARHTHSSVSAFMSFTGIVL